MINRVIEIYKGLHDLQSELNEIQLKCKHVIRRVEEHPSGGNVEVCGACDLITGPASNEIKDFNLN